MRADSEEQTIQYLIHDSKNRKTERSNETRQDFTKAVRKKTVTASSNIEVHVRIFIRIRNLRIALFRRITVLFQRFNLIGGVGSGAQTRGVTLHLGNGRSVDNNVGWKTQIFIVSQILWV